MGLILGGVALLAAAFRSSETDEEAISRQLKSLAEAVGIREGEGLLYRRARLSEALSDILTDSARVNAPELGRAQQGRGAITMLATRAGTLYQAGQVELGDIEIHVGDSRDSAQAQAVASVAASAHPELLGREKRQVVFELVRQHGDWRVESVDVALPDNSFE
ncbi:MAG: hypothetical protein JW940_31270 [Polyangiaceae bacterium]|nr:hypothetical protein [Polyangiaceae bacterium]